MSKKTGAQILAEVLIEQGVDTVFGYPGATVLHIYDALYDYRDRIQHILTSHEQGAAHAADGYARSSGKTGVVIATSGPGATNLVTGIATAYMDSVPLVAITGNVDLSALGSDSFQEIDIAGITIPITKYSFIVKDISELADCIREGFRIANSGRKGPVLIDIPKNITLDETEYNPEAKEVPSEHPLPSKNELLNIAEIINGANKPLLYIGGGVVSSDASTQLIEFAKKADIPVASTLMGLGGFPASEPLFLGLIGMHGTDSANTAAKSCDVLIAAGTRFSDRVVGNKESFSPNSKIIHIDIDPAEIDKNICSDFHLCGDLRQILSSLSNYIKSADHSEWKSALCENKVLEKASKKSGFVNPRVLVETLNRLVDDDTIIVTDVGEHQIWTAQYYKFNKPRTFITSGGLGTMGFGLGAAIGAKTANPKKQVILISGDGSFHMNLNETATLASNNIKIIDIVMNNGVLGMVRQWQKTFFGNRLFQTSLNRKTDIPSLAKSFGVCGMKIQSDSCVERVLKKALKSDLPVIIDCRISPDEDVSSSVSSQIFGG